MKVLIVSHTSVQGAPLAAYGDKRAHDAKRLADQIGGYTIGPVELNRDIPADAKTLFEVEMTKDGAVRGVDEYDVLGVLKAGKAPGWDLWETPRRWRLSVRQWAKSRQAAEESARLIYVGVTTGKRAKSGVL